MGMNREDAYYEPEDDDSEEIQERIDFELKNRNYPYSVENIRECFFEDGFEGTWPVLSSLLKQGDTAAAGVVLSATLYTYWEQRSEREVLENL